MDSNLKSEISLLAKILAMEEFTTLTVGFCTIMRVDKNTFTIRSVDNEVYVNSLNPDSIEEVELDDTSQRTTIFSKN